MLLASPLPDLVPAARRVPRRAARALVFHRADVVRAGIVALLSDGTDCEVVGEGRIHEALRSATDLTPSIALFEYGPADGPDICRLLGGLWPRPRLVALVERPDLVPPHAAIAAGADAAVVADAVRGETLLSIVGRVRRGEHGLVAGFQRTVVGDGAERVSSDPAARLTRREREILHLIGEGLSNREIADALVVSIKTVEAHRANIARKLGQRNRAGLMRLALASSVA